MTIEELKARLDTTGLPVAYAAFPETDAPDMPFICYMATGTLNYAADGEVYSKIQRVEIQLFTRYKDVEAEAVLEVALQGLYWNNEEEYEEDELCHRVTYSVSF